MDLSCLFCNDNTKKLTGMQTITVAKGDGIGPEIMDAVLDILTAAGARIKWEEIEVGERSYLAGEYQWYRSVCMGQYQEE